jgi:hypothetical protein
MSLIEALHGRAAMAELKLHGRPWELAREQGKGRGSGAFERTLLTVGTEEEGGAPWGGSWGSVPPARC